MEQMTDLLGNFDISISGLIAGFIFGVIGLWLFKQARRRSDLRLVIISFALMFYPYFTRGPLADWGLGLVLCGLAYYYWHHQSESI